MTAWQQNVLVLGAFVAIGLLYAISKNMERLLEEARRIRQALEKRAGE